MAILSLFKFVKDQVSFPAGHVIFKEDETGDVAYVVIEGEVDITFKGQLLETVGSGGLIGEMALIDDQTRSGTATAKTETKAVKIDKNRFTFMVQETPMFALEVMKIMADRLRREHERLNIP
ncbi:MAG: cyclic nucleotide-binding domain-containing protein [Anaerolineaceae bacterium]|nr:cyclic nucleotide-binding domain-containing protein [Anaerolineaceae bacterium]